MKLPKDKSGATPKLGADRLRQLLSYDAATGAFRWIGFSGSKFPGHLGQEAGSIAPNGYVTIRVEGVLYLAHRLAWLLMTGVWPVDQIDHLNGLRNDNRWCNLRQATHLLNCQNRRSSMPSSVAGLLGVSRKRDKYRARIGLPGQQINLGVFPTKEAAHVAYVAAKRRLHEGNTL